MKCSLLVAAVIAVLPPAVASDSVNSAPVKPAAAAVRQTLFDQSSPRESKESALSSATPNARLPFVVAKALRHYGVEATPEGLAAGLGSADESARMWSLAGLGLIGTSRQLGAVLNQVAAPDKHGMQRNAIGVAAAIGKRSGGLDDRTREYLLSMSKDMLSSAKSNNGRLRAAELMCQLGDVSASRVVADCLQAKVAVPGAVAVAREFVQAKAPRADGSEPDWTALFKAVVMDGSRSYLERIDAVGALADIGTPEAIAAIRGALAVENEKNGDVGLQMQSELAKAERKSGDGSPLKN